MIINSFPQISIQLKFTPKTCIFCHISCPYIENVKMERNGYNTYLCNICNTEYLYRDGDIAMYSIYFFHGKKYKWAANYMSNKFKLFKIVDPDNIDPQAKNYELVSESETDNEITPVNIKEKLLNYIEELFRYSQLVFS